MSKLKTIFGAIALVATTAALTTTVMSQNEPPSEEEMMAMMMKFMTPAEDHAKLDAFQGKYDFTVKMWMAPGAPPDISENKGDYEWMLDRHFMRGNFEGEFFGQPFNGLDITGYDIFREEYVSIWLDNFSTGVMITRGKMNDDGVIVMHGTMDDVMSQTKDLPVKTKLYMNDKGERVYEMYIPGPDGKMFKHMEVAGRKQKRSINER